ncbi:hypothetical protein M2161_008484 [Streptomyces sp. SAI-133]|uniref:hypothetical protein n=1 Tax=unclassified Streptomyces TaxID=2593676 RepID=UPI0024752D10|nr:hypothetical protein [Streptomyces sp. SAI-133]MDH6589378.1 hypothetical protein [Streptomyces sp. SAI-133]
MTGAVGTPGTAGSVFPTFCHISEYGEPGYQSLHSLLALSQPLNLWAPSSVLIRHATQIPAKSFVRYVDQGFIRIQAREPWLTDRAHRDGHPWDYARWDDEIDGALLSILRNDEGLPESERRVLAAPPERGEELAAERLARDPGQVAYWYGAYRGAGAARRIPEGTLDTARLYTDGTPFNVAKLILRVAYNHGAAFELSGAKAPLLLSQADRRFVRLITRARTADGVPVPAPTAPSRNLASELAIQLLDVLRLLDVHAGPRDLDTFLRGRGRQELVQWIADVCERYRHHPRRELDGLIIRELRHTVSRDRFRSPLSELRERPMATAVGSIALAAGAVDFVLAPGNAMGIAGMAAGAYQLVSGLARQMGWAPTAFDGPQWPFLYAYSSKAKRSQVAKMAYALSRHPG